MVHAILDGEWSDDPPSWFHGLQGATWSATPDNTLRAAQSAEFCILLFQTYNPRFNVDTFLRACGLK